MIGIICAMEEEIRDIESEMDIEREEVFSSIKFRIGTYCGKKCVVALSGVGKVFASVCAQTMILKYSPEYILNVGTAGGIGLDVDIFNLVIAKNVIQHDYDISAFVDKKIGEISGLGIREIPCNDNLIKIAESVSKNLKMKFHLGNIATGDQFIGDSKKIEYIRNEFDALACEMECGSIGQVCYINKVPFLALKIISDRADKSSLVDFQNFIVEYPQIMNNIIREIIFKI